MGAGGRTLLSMTESHRCAWCGTDPLYVAYHDQEWGVPERDARALWEKLVLDGFQAGLAWITVLHKREALRAAFAGFDPEIVARFGPEDRARLMSDPGIIRSNAKIDSAIASARLWLDMRERGEDFSALIWDAVDGHPVQNEWRHQSDLPAETDQSRALAKALKARGFKFCGPVIVYAFMQATGLVNDHVVSCHRHGAVRQMSA